MYYKSGNSCRRGMPCALLCKGGPCVLRGRLQNLMVTLESSAVHDREDLKREQLRLSREAARVEAATSSLQAERDDLRVQVRRDKSRMRLC